MTCAETAEPIEMQFGMLSRVGSENMYYMGSRCPHGKRHFWSVWAIEKHCTAYDLRVDTCVSSAKKNGRTDLNLFLHKELPFLGRYDCTCVKIFSGVTFLIAINSLTL